MTKNRRLSIRIDERTGLILDELSNKLDTNVSRIICALLQKSVEELVDKDGNLKINEQEPIQEE